MATTTAKTKKDVDEMTARERLYDSLNYSYGKKGENISKEYDKAYSQADRQALSRGMQRSSYNNQVLANLNQQKIDALDNNESQMIADYENRLGELEQQEKANEQWERQFAESQRQYNESLAYQKERANVADTQWNQQFQYQQSRDTVADQQWQKQYDEQLRQFNENMAYQKERANVSDQQWEKQYQASLDQFNQQMAQQKAEAEVKEAAKRMEAFVDRKQKYRHDFKVAAFGAVLALLFEHYRDIKNLVYSALKALGLL